MRYSRVLAGILIVTWMSASAFAAEERTISLAGPWRFIRGGPDAAGAQGALPALKFSDSIHLPGTTDTEKKGPPNDGRSTGSLSQPYSYTGTCWYERNVTIPESWRGKRTTLVLERTKYSQCWIDGKPIGDNPIVCTPQEYEAGILTPGPHKITIAVNNKRLPPFGADSHQYSGNTQGNWNGIIGKIELHASDAVSLDDVQIYSDAAAKKVTIKVRLTNTAQPVTGGALVVTAKGEGIGSDATKTLKIDWPAGETLASIELPLGEQAALWDEFHPTLHQLTVRLDAPGISDERQVTFGLRDFAAHGQQFTINGVPTFLRGKHDGCVFPLTGHPPMTVDGWLDYLHVCQSYGLNHIRFHTWTPPEAAFEAADQLGFYLQPELPFWGAFDQKVKDALKPEADRILIKYGNHPSFVMFSMGNEHWAGADVLQSLVAELKAADPRHLYIRGTNAFSYTGRPGIGDDYLINADEKPLANGPLFKLRGSNGATPIYGHVQIGPADTLTTYANAIAGATWPTVTHEMGQYTVFPDFKQIAKYTGVSRAYNLEAFKKNVESAGMLDLADAFAKSSGALAALCYREEIESCLRTPHYGGFELLDLQDYPGQGTALVGMLDAFMDSKGILTPEQWRQFCAPAVLLAKFSKYTWTTDETFAATIDLAQYGDKDLNGAVLNWSLTDAANKTLSSGTLPAIDAKRGDVRAIGLLSIPLTNLPAPSRVTLNLGVAGTSVKTSYNLWIYPPKIDTQPPADVTVARTFDAAAQQALAAGKRVILFCDERKPLARTVGGGFATDFWNFSFFHNKPGTLGLLCDPASPALTGFPTESHTDWQWFYIALHAQPLILDKVLPRQDRPIVQVIDNDERCHKLGLLFEAKVGSGRLLVCASDLIALAPAHPEARQLLASLFAYAASDRFDPQTEVSNEVLRKLLRTTIPMTGDEVTASSFDKGWQNYSPAQIIDGNDDKGWKADADATGDAWCQIKFAKPTDLHGGEITFPEAGSGYRYRIEASSDGTNWKTISDQQQKNNSSDARQEVALNAKAVGFVRVVVSATPDHHPAGVNEVRFYATE